MIAERTDAVASDPSPLLVAAFRSAAARMRSLGVVNPALEVEAVGFAPWEGRWLGVLVTPWSMNLTLAPREAAAWSTLALGAKRAYRFPAGVYEFIGAHDPAFGEYQICSLFSPMDNFADQQGARVVAELARAALLDPANDDDAASVAARRAPLSRRDVLFGRFGRIDDGRRG